MIFLLLFACVPLFAVLLLSLKKEITMLRDDLERLQTDYCDLEEEVADNDLECILHFRQLHEMIENKK